MDLVVGDKECGFSKKKKKEERKVKGRKKEIETFEERSIMT